MKTIDKLPRAILIKIAKEFGYQTPENEDSWHLAKFISDSITETTPKKGAQQMKNITITLALSDISRITAHLKKGIGEIDDILMEIVDQSRKQE